MNDWYNPIFLYMYFSRVLQHQVPLPRLSTFCDLYEAYVPSPPLIPQELVCLSVGPPPETLLIQTSPRNDWRWTSQVLLSEVGTSNAIITNNNLFTTRFNSYGFILLAIINASQIIHDQDVTDDVGSRSQTPVRLCRQDFNTELYVAHNKVATPSV